MINSFKHFLNQHLCQVDISPALCRYVVHLPACETWCCLVQYIKMLGRQFLVKAAILANEMLGLNDSWICVLVTWKKISQIIPSYDGLYIYSRKISQITLNKLNMLGLKNKSYSKGKWPKDFNHSCVSADFCASTVTKSGDAKPSPELRVSWHNSAKKASKQPENRRRISVPVFFVTKFRPCLEIRIHFRLFFFLQKFWSTN